MPVAEFQTSVQKAIQIPFPCSTSMAERGVLAIQEQSGGPESCDRHSPVGRSCGTSVNGQQDVPSGNRYR